MQYGSMTHDFTGRKIKKKATKGETFQKYNAPAFRQKSNAMVTYRRDAGVTYESVDSDTINTAPVEKKTYTGTLVKGIATMHKSNAVPIIDQEQATDIANMRRN
jgi:hypothetical protein